MRSTILGAVAVAMTAASVASADLVGTVGGQTNVLLDLELLAAAANLNLTGISDGVIAPGNLGDGSVAFVITPPTSSVFPTTFNYDTNDFFGTVNGSINHRGTITFNDVITVGNFEITLGDGGFVVNDTFGGLGTLFDLGVTSAFPSDLTFDATADLLVSASFAQALLDLGLASSNLTGADVGDAWIQGFNQVIPAPGAAAILAIAGLVGSRRRR
ncbi:MAG: hypothetical protein ACO4CI_03145 [Phycisphaerales bacterium]